MNFYINGKFLSQRMTGVQRFAYEIINELDQHITKDKITLCVPENARIPQYTNIKVKRVGKLHGNLWEQISFPLYCIRKKAVSINLCNTAPLINPGIVCIHDVKIKSHPEYFSKRFCLWYELLFKNETKRAKQIITVSEFSKKEIIKYYNASENQITVIPNAWQHYARICFDKNTLKRYGLNKEQYFFALGSMDPNKNFKWITEQAKSMPQQIFVIAGSVNKEVFSNKFNIDCPSNMKLIGFVSDEEAKTLMRDCSAFLFPSIYEGFGIPPLEAISAGCKKIVVSDTEVMHEVFGDLVNYADLYKNEFNLNDLKQINNKDKETLLSKYSWSKSAILLRNLLLKVWQEKIEQK